MCVIILMIQISILLRLEHDATLAVEWFESNYMKLG